MTPTGSPPGASAGLAERSAPARRPRLPRCASSGSSPCSLLFVARHGDHPAALPRAARTSSSSSVDTTIFALLARRRDDGRPHAERRPVDRLGARALGVPLGGPLRPPSRHPDPARVPRRASRSASPAASRSAASTVVGRVPSLVVTLAALYIIRGIDVLIVGGGQVVASSLPERVHRDPEEDVPRHSRSSRSSIAVVIAVAAYYLRSFRSGRDLYAIGSNPDAARLAGIPSGPARVHRVRGQRRRRRRRGRALRGALRHDRLDRRQRATSCR